MKSNILFENDLSDRAEDCVRVRLQHRGQEKNEDGSLLFKRR